MDKTLVVGLGNPGVNYIKTRHNVGFMVVDAILQDENFEIVKNSKFQGELFKKGSLFLLKPLTFMNLSGISVFSVKNFYRINRVIVIHDDLDLKLGRLKFKNGGSSGGHNGIKSIDENIGSNYDRVRVGIGSKLNEDAKKFVLANFTCDEMECLQNVLKVAKNATLELLKSSIDEISCKYANKNGVCL